MSLFKTSLDKNWNLSVQQQGTAPKKVHIRYFNDQGFPTKLGVSLDAFQFEFLSHLKSGFVCGLHVVTLPDRCILFKESNMGYISGCTVPVNVVNKIPNLYIEVAKYLNE